MTKNKEINWFKRSNKVMFSWKKSEKTTKNSVFVSKEFSTRVKTSLAHVIAWLIPAASKPLIMKSFWCFRWLHISKIHRALKMFQITQFEGYFNVARCNSVWQLFANSISIPSVELVWDKFICWLIDANIQRLETCS